MIMQDLIDYTQITLLVSGDNVHHGHIDLVSKILMSQLLNKHHSNAKWIHARMLMVNSSLKVILLESHVG